MKLVAQYSLLHRVANQPEPDLPALTPLIARWHGQRVRRIDRYIQLCLAGALNCVEDRSLPADTGVYIASRGGAVSTAATGMARREALGLMPKPLHFVNTLGNSAGYYLTQLLGINGGALVVSQEELSFEAALLHAWLDLSVGRIGTALVGGFDEVVPPTAQHLERLGAAPDEPGLYEGSHWLLLERQGLGLESEPEALEQGTEASVALGQPRWFSGLDELARWLSTRPEDTLVQTCFSPDGEERRLLGASGREVRHFLPTGGAPHGTFSGAGLTALSEGVEKGAEKAAGKEVSRPRVHIARGARSPYCAVTVAPGL